MNKEIIDKLYSLHRFGIKPGLERITNLLSAVGNPHSNLRTIHIAGTNGKGSTSSLIASILMEAGLKVGLYTSPHLIRFNERIKINGEEIDDNTLISLSEKYLPFSEKIDATFFEITTAMAFDYFNSQNVDIAIIETGMGGRYDATNVVNPLVSVITSISLEHKEYLGDTVEKIAFEKAGIIKENTPVVVSKNDKNILEVINTVAEEKHSRFLEAGELETVIQHQFLSNLTTEVCVNFNGNLAYTTLPLPGAHQIDNLELALSALLQTDFDISLENVSDGISKVKENTGLSTRIELLKSEPKFIIDSAHNEAAVKSLVDTLSTHLPNIKYNVTFAAMSDKDIRALLKLLKPICDKLILTQPNIARAASVAELRNIAIELGYINIVSTQNTHDALDDLNFESNNLIVGSFYLTGEILDQLNKI